jgi:hypothetical protein
MRLPHARCTKQCPKSISRLFLGDPNPQSLSYALSDVVKWRQNCCNEISYDNFQAASFNLQDLIFVRFSLAKNHLYEYVIEQLNALDSRLLTLFFGACFLKIASILDRGHSSS